MLRFSLRMLQDHFSTASPERFIRISPLDKGTGADHRRHLLTHGLHAETAPEGGSDMGRIGYGYVSPDTTYGVLLFCGWNIGDLHCLVGIVQAA